MPEERSILSGRTNRGPAPAAQDDYIGCGAGSSGSVVARGLAERTGASVLLIEAGSSDLVPSSTDPSG